MKPLPRDFEPDESEFLHSLGGQPFGPCRSEHCPPAAMIQALLAGALPDQDAAALSHHLSVCPACDTVRAALDEMQPEAAEPGDIDGLWNRIEPQLPRTKRLHWAWIWVPAAAAAAFALAVLGPSLLAPEPLTLAYQPPAPAAPSQPDWQAGAFEKPPVRLPVGGLLLWRGSGAEALPESTREIARALEPYRAGDLDEAVRRLAALEDRFPESFEIPFYRGVCLLYLNRAGAGELLVRARGLGTEAKSAEASWYLALAHLQDGSVSRARPLLRQVCGTVSPHADSACGILRELSGVRFTAAGR
jgi:hypothetical protein